MERLWKRALMLKWRKRAHCTDSLSKRQKLQWPDLWCSRQGRVNLKPSSGSKVNVSLCWYVIYYYYTITYFSVCLERPLEVTEPIKNVKAKEKSSAILSCKFSAPPKDVHWFKGDVPLATSDKYNIKQDVTRAQLTIQKLTEEDSGEYRCQSGPAESKGTLTVEGTLWTCAFSMPFCNFLFMSWFCWAIRTKRNQ